MIGRDVPANVARLRPHLAPPPAELRIMGTFDVGGGYAAKVTVRVAADPRWRDWDPQCLIFDLA